ncbi:transposase [Mesorhizobium sp. M0976]|uniref:transposase n=1 Tax=Mesorhizobium sp. M0976 TaxID=2957038 RepID=UPI0033369F2B
MRIRADRPSFNILERPDIPLHTNGSENDIRSVVTRRKISSGSHSDQGRAARDAVLGMMKTRRKLGISFSGFNSATASASRASRPHCSPMLVAVR